MARTRRDRAAGASTTAEPTTSRPPAGRAAPGDGGREDGALTSPVALSAAASALRAAASLSMADAPTSPSFRGTGVRFGHFRGGRPRLRPGASGGARAALVRQWRPGPIPGNPMEEPWI